MAYDDRSLRGVGGWLAFFILTLIVIGPARAIWTTSQSLYGDPTVAAAYGSWWGVLQGVEWTLLALSIAASVYFGWRLYAVPVWRSVQLTIAGLWIVGPSVQLIDLAAVSLIAGVSFAAMLAEIVGEIVRGLVYAAIWTAYLLRSQRVANTYARHPDTAQLGTVFE